MAMVQTAHPPCPALAFIASTISISLGSLSNIFSTIDEASTVETITTPRFEDVFSKTMLGYIRLSIASMIFYVSVYRILAKQ